VLNANGLPQHLLIVGGGSEIAAAIAARMADGPLERVALLGPNVETLSRTAAGLTPAVSDVETFPLDLSQPDEAAAALEPAMAWLGSVDSAIIASGILPDQHLADHDPHLVARTFSVNATGPAACLTVVADHMEHAGTGQLIVLSSVAATVVRRRSYLYDASKAALDRFALGLADRLEPAVGVHIVRPVFVETRMTANLARPPLVLSVDAVAHATIEGIQAKQRVIWVPKPARIGAAALGLLPRSLLRRLPI